VLCGKEPKNLRVSEFLGMRTYLYSIRKLPEVKVLAIVEDDRVGIFLGKFTPIQTLLEGCKPVNGAHEVAHENEKHRYFYVAAI